MAARPGKDKKFYAALTRASGKDKETRDRVAQQYGYVHDPDLSTGDIAVYAKPDKSHAVVSLAGTDFTNFKDIKADIGVVAGQVHNTQRYKESEDATRKVLGKYGKNVTLSGYSLGGAVADKLGQQMEMESVVFNPGSNPLLPTRKGSNTKVYSHNNDLVSKGYKGWNPRYFKKGWKGMGRELLKDGARMLLTGGHDLKEDDMYEV